uniref:Uncharacterized protein n=1 Tax=Kalanchoe fedtschenkoi TaxID=63787 RepID=A0A7N0U563_KALFE
MWDKVLFFFIALPAIVGSTCVLHKYSIPNLDIRVLIWFAGFLLGLIAPMTHLLPLPFSPIWFLRLIAPLNMIFTSCSFVLQPYCFQDLIFMLAFGIGHPLLFGIFLSVFAWLLDIRNYFDGADYIVLSCVMAATYPTYVLKVPTQFTRSTIYNLTVGESVFGTALCVLLVQSLTHGSSISSVMAVVSLRYVLTIVIGVSIGVALGMCSAHIYSCLEFCCDQIWVDSFAILVGTIVWVVVFAISSVFDIPLNIPLAIFCSVVSFFYMSAIESRDRMPGASSLSDAVVFLYLGYTAFDIDIWSSLRYSVMEVLIAASILFVLLMLLRLAFIFCILKFCNCDNRSPRISKRDVMILWFAGLARGGPSLAISYVWFASSASDNDVFMIATTIYLVHFSLSVFGLCTMRIIQCWPTLYQWLGWSRGSSEQLSPV